MSLYREANDMRGGNAKIKMRRNADLGKKEMRSARGKRGKVREEEQFIYVFLFVFPSVITRTHFPEGHCTC